MLFRIGTRSVVFVLFAGGLLTACDGPFEPLPEDTPREAVVAFRHQGVPMELETALSHLWMRPGDTLTIRVAIRNLGQETATFQFNSGCNFLFGVGDADGRVIRQPGGVCHTGAPVFEILPGEELSRTLTWDGRVWTDGGREKVPVRPGIYQVWGVFYYWGPEVPLEVRW